MAGSTPLDGGNPETAKYQQTNSTDPPMAGSTHPNNGGDQQVLQELLDQGADEMLEEIRKEKTMAGSAASLFGGETLQEMMDRLAKEYGPVMTTAGSALHDTDDPDTQDFSTSSIVGSQQRCESTERLKYLMEESAKAATGGVLPPNWRFPPLLTGTELEHIEAVEEQPFTAVDPESPVTADTSAQPPAEPTSPQKPAEPSMDADEAPATLEDASKVSIPSGGQPGKTRIKRKPKASKEKDDKPEISDEDPIDEHGLRPILPKALRLKGETAIGSSRRVLGQARRGAVEKEAKDRKRNHGSESGEGSEAAMVSPSSGTPLTKPPARKRRKQITDAERRTTHPEILEFPPEEKRKSAKELCRIAVARPHTKPQYMTIGLWRHYQAPYAFSYRGRLIAEYFHITDLEDKAGKPLIPDSVARTMIDNYDIWKRSRVFGTQVYGTKDIRTRAIKTEADQHDDTAGSARRGQFVKKIGDTDEARRLTHLEKDSLYAEIMEQKGDDRQWMAGVRAPGKKTRVSKREKEQHKVLTEVVKERANLNIMKGDLAKGFQMAAKDVQRRHDEEMTMSRKKMEVEMKASKARVAELEKMLKASQSEVLEPGES